MSEAPTERSSDPQALRILISSPGDVTDEREHAREVIHVLQQRYAGQFVLAPILWEDLPLQATDSFQDGINTFLSEEHGIDIAIFILWSRLGSKLRLQRRADQSEYRSGTECELDLVMQAYEKSGGVRPNIFVYTRQDDEGFLKQALRSDDLSAPAEVDSLLEQKLSVEKFIREQFQDSDSGHNIGAYLTYKSPLSFRQRLQTHLSTFLDGSSHSSSNWEGSPYQGLEVFNVEHSHIFFGRDQETYEVIDLLHAQKEAGCGFVLIVGASGSGKSSLARAGVLARMETNEEVHQWRHAIMTPAEIQADPFLSMARALLRALPELAQRITDESFLIADIKEHPERFLSSLQQALFDVSGEQGSTSLVLLVDQLEELFTHPQIRDLPELPPAFAQTLELLATTPRVFVLATVRGDFYGHCQDLTKLMDLKGANGQYDLLPPKPASIRAIISLPAQVAGFAFERQQNLSLDQLILDETATQPEVLPLLEFALRSLFESCQDRPDRLLTFEAYHELGGISGALARRADHAYHHGKDVGDEQRESFSKIMWQLVLLRASREGVETPVRVSARYDELILIDNAQPLVDALIQERLLVANRDPQSGHSTVMVAHEALFREWGLLVDWIQQNAKSLTIHTRIQDALRIWEEQDRADGYLLAQGKPLEEARLLVENLGATELLRDKEKSFLFRSNLVNGQAKDALWWSQELIKTQENLRESVLLEALNPETSKDPTRLHAALAAGYYAGPALKQQLLTSALQDPNRQVKREAALALGELDDPQIYEQLVGKLRDRKLRSQAKLALSRLRIAADGPISDADRTIQANHFEQHYKKIPNATRSQIRLSAWGLRLKEGFSLIPIIVIPATIFGAVGAALYKWLPASFGLAACQGTPSPGMGIFHGLSAGVVWAGGVTLAIVIFRVGFAVRDAKPSMLRPRGALWTGILASLPTSAINTLAIALVFNPTSLEIMGWTEDVPKTRLSWDFFQEILFETRFGWVFIFCGIGFGLATGMISNAIEASQRWKSYLGSQTTVSNFSQVVDISLAAARRILPYSWTLLVFPLMGGAVAYWACDPAMEPPSKWPTWDNPNLFLALSIAADCLCIAIGGFMALVGMGLGTAIVRHGVDLEPRKN
ncbi:MAG: AAA family ATPase [Verrucomicrobiota bacterium]